VNISWRPILQLARPAHWVKNVVVFMPLVFSRRMNDLDAWLSACHILALFCCLSSIAYIVNDIRDYKIDRLHPAKKKRPLAAEMLSRRAAVVEAVMFLGLAIFLAVRLPAILRILALAFLVLQICYTFLLKREPLLDVLTIALGFVLRTYSGTIAIRSEISPWLFICIFTICLFLGFCKRYNELVTFVDQNAARKHRRILGTYSPELLTHLITVSAGIAVLAFLSYAVNDSTIERFGTNYFVYTLPVVIYSIFRFAMLSMNGAYSDPTDIILHDRPFQFAALLWALSALIIILWGKDICAWLQMYY